jgi:hypothetical protein
MEKRVGFSPYSQKTDHSSLISLAVVLAREDEVHLHTPETKTVHF